MTLHELRNGLVGCKNFLDCDAFLSAHFCEIRLLFYGYTDEQLCKNFLYLEYEEEVLIPLENSVLGNALRSGERPPPSLIALLILFLSLFERSKHYAAMQSVINLLPRGPLHDRGDALCKFKYIQNAKIDYIRQFDCILTLLQQAWEQDNDAGREQCEDLLLEYFLDALLRPQDAGFDIRQEIVSCFEQQSTQQRYPIVESLFKRKAFSWWGNKLRLEHEAVRTRIVESLHAESFSLASESESVEPEKEPVDEVFSDSLRVCTELPSFLDDLLDEKNAVYAPQRVNAKFNFGNDAQDNRNYFGTYFPRTVIESWNIFSELLDIPTISTAFSQKRIIRIFDVGSGTGGAIVGFLLALESWGQFSGSVEIAAIDCNQDALDKQKIMLDAISSRFSFSLKAKMRYQPLQSTLNGFFNDFSKLSEAQENKHDVVIFWKCLSEFYNVNYASAQGIVRAALVSASRMLAKHGLCTVADVTSKDNGYEYFSTILNREANEHDRLAEAQMRTIIPLPCGTSPILCEEKNCFTQRRFQVIHRLAKQQTKIAYRVLASSQFSDAILKNLTRQKGYRVNGANPEEACVDRKKVNPVDKLPCGYTHFHL